MIIFLVSPKGVSLFLGSLDFFEDLIDDSASQENSGSSSDGPEEIGKQGKGSNAESSEIGSNGDVSVKFFLKKLISSTICSNVLVFKTLGNLLGTVSTNRYPESRNQRTRYQNESNVNDSVKRVLDHAFNRLGSSQVINESTDWEALSSNSAALPNTQPSDDSELLEVIVDDP